MISLPCPGPAVESSTSRTGVWCHFGQATIMSPIIYLYGNSLSQLHQHYIYINIYISIYYMIRVTKTLAWLGRLDIYL